MFRSRLYVEWIQVNKEKTNNPIEKWAKLNRSFMEEEDKKCSTSTGKETNLISNSIQFSSVAQSCLTLCDPMDCSTPGLPVHHQLPELTQTHVHWVSDAIQPSHPLSAVSHCFHWFPIYLPWIDGTRWHDLSFLMLSWKPTFSLSSFTYIKRLFSSSLSAIRVVSSAYLRLLIFLPAILIPACASFSLAFGMLYSAYQLNKQGDHIQPCSTPVLIWNQSVVL